MQNPPVVDTAPSLPPVAATAGGISYVSVCSGIEAASAAWHPLGWHPLAFAEIEPFPCAVLKHHHPRVPNLGDLTKHHEWPELRPDVLVGGTPCQAFSVAGLRKGLADPRGNLTLVFLGLVARMRPRWVVWENVPGVLSDATGAFGSLLGGLGQLGYGFTYRVLDAQYVRVESHARAVPQRRRRVFVVGHLGDWRRAAAVLFERASLCGNPPPRREAGQRPSATLSARTQGGRGLGTDFDLDGGICATLTKNYASHHGRTAGNNGGVAEGQLIPEVCGALPTHHTLNGHGCAGVNNQQAFSGQLIPELCGTLSDGAHMGGGLTDRTPTRDESSLPPVAWALQERDSKGTDSDTKEGHLIPMLQGGFFSDVTPIQNATRGQDQNGLGIGGEVMFTLDRASQHGVQHLAAVRRLTPRECERLQGFPDDYTLIPWRGKPPEDCPDGPRYKALGNSMAVNVMRWIGERIQLVETLP